MEFFCGIWKKIPQKNEFAENEIQQMNPKIHFAEFAGPLLCFPTIHISVLHLLSILKLRSLPVAFPA